MPINTLGMNPILHDLYILAMILAAAACGMLVRRILPEHHLCDDTRTHFAATVSVVVTLAALVMGFAINNANNARLATLQDLSLLSSNITRAGAMLGQYGPEARDGRVTLGRYAEQKLEDLFPQMTGVRPKQSNAATDGLVDRLQMQIVSLNPKDDVQRFRQLQALEASNQIVIHQSAIAEQQYARAPHQIVNAITLWLVIVFFSYGLFAPKHVTAIAAMVLSAIAVSIAILMILEGRLPFDGLVPIPSGSLSEAVASVRR